eukprot:TRINITY_DN9455_c0_g4_i8.p1 TRINITY_DN9455_c0_g4~~TRINITY_DN9455_c0_g4_i8.p1  ORF type:complete len:454 (-),score=71.16 TRINITY_DN9455_c0_g4_i8:93-1454(-)
MRNFLCILFIRLLYVSAKYTPDLSSTNFVPPKTIQNYIDHDNTLKGTFTQHYFELKTFYDNARPKAVLYLCGEVTCGLPGKGSLGYKAAEEVKAAYYALEHRFYGESQPMPDWSTGNLKYLTPNQALSDAAFFIESMNREFNRTHGKVPKWAVLSGSYPGALAAWLRYKYPHLVAGAVASSAVVNSFAEFPKFEEHFIAGLDKCPGRERVSILQKYQAYATEQMSSPGTRKNFLKLFNVTDMNMLEFPYFFADLPITPIMLGKLNEVCGLLKRMEESGKSIQDQIKELAEYVNGNFGLSAQVYTFSYLKDTNVSSNKFLRQWNYQACNSFGWFQTPAFPRHIRWQGMNLTYWKRYCEAIFEEQKWPDTEHVNTVFAGEEIAKHGSNIFFTQGEQDGWQWAGIRGNLYSNPRIEVAVIKDVSHCADLHTEKPSDPESLKEVRKREIRMLNKWLQ